MFLEWGSSHSTRDSNSSHIGGYGEENKLTIYKKTWFCLKFPPLLYLPNKIHLNIKTLPTAWKHFQINMNSKTNNNDMEEDITEIINSTPSMVRLLCSYIGYVGCTIIEQRIRPVQNDQRIGIIISKFLLRIAKKLCLYSALPPHPPIQYL
jgi:hypothetical protein